MSKQSTETKFRIKYFRVLQVTCKLVNFQSYRISVHLRFSVYIVNHCLFVWGFNIFLLAILVSVLRFTTSDYSFFEFSFFFNYCCMYVAPFYLNKCDLGLAPNCSNVTEYLYIQYITSLMTSINML